MNKNLPKDYNDCLIQFDSILTDAAIEYFKNDDSAVAAINIANEIGNLFIGNWYLSYHFRTNPTVTMNTYSYDFRFPKTIPSVVRFFNEDSITDPHIMIRILFNGYYKYLNKIEFNWENEIKALKPYQFRNDDENKFPRKSELLEEMERNILADYRFRKFQISDTVKIYWVKFPGKVSSSAKFHTLTGIVKNKEKSKKYLGVELINIISHYPEDINYIVTENDTIEVGDIFDGYYFELRKIGDDYFHYQNNERYRFN